MLSGAEGPRPGRPVAGGGERAAGGPRRTPRTRPARTRPRTSVQTSSRERSWSPWGSLSWLTTSMSVQSHPRLRRYQANPPVLSAGPEKRWRARGRGRGVVGWRGLSEGRGRPQYPEVPSLLRGWVSRWGAPGATGMRVGAGVAAGVARVAGWGRAQQCRPPGTRGVPAGAGSPFGPGVTSAPGRVGWTAAPRSTGA